MAKYWFAHFGPLRREDFGLKSTDVATYDLMRDRLFSGGFFRFSWQLRHARPIATEGVLVLVLAIAALAGGIVSLAWLAHDADKLWGLAIVGWVALIALGYQAIVEHTMDPAKTVEEYDAERESIKRASAKAHWLRWPTGGGNG